MGLMALEELYVSYARMQSGCRMRACREQMLGKIELNDSTTINRNNNFQTFTQSLIVLFRFVLSACFVTNVQIKIKKTLKNVRKWKAIKKRL